MFDYRANSFSTHAYARLLWLPPESLLGMSVVSYIIYISRVKHLKGNLTSHTHTHTLTRADAVYDNRREYLHPNVDVRQIAAT